MIYTTEKTLRDYGDKISSDERKKIEEKIERVKEAMRGESADQINKSIDELMQASHKIAEEIYKQASTQQQAASGEPPREEKKEEKKEEKGKEGAVDADFEVVDDK